MSVHKRINEAHDYLARGDPEAALTPLLNAVDTMSGGGRTRYKRWVAGRMPIISNCLLDCGPSAKTLKVPVDTDNECIAEPDEHGSTGLEEIIYHLIRCGLDHRCEVDPAVRDNHQSSVRWNPATRTLHLHYGKLATGLLLALVSALSEHEGQRIRGGINGYSLRHFCGLEVEDVLTMVRTLAKQPTPTVSESDPA